MPLLKTDFIKQLLILLLITVLLGTALVRFGGYLTDNYFSRMVSGLIGEYGEYDLLFTLASDKKKIARSQIEKVFSGNFPGVKLDSGPEVAGSSNYLAYLPAEYKNEEIYANINRYFSDIPGLMSISIISEPRLALRGFRGDSLQEIRPIIDSIEGIDFTYTSSDGIDILVKNPELLPGVKKEVKEILDNYHLFEIRYPLHQHPEDLEQLKENVIEITGERSAVEDIIDVTNDMESSRVSLLKSLKEMKAFLLSYASKVIINDIENSERVAEGSQLLVPGGDSPVVLEVIEKNEQSLSALIIEGQIKDRDNLSVYTKSGEIYLGQGLVNNPRQDLARALDKLNEISPRLNGFLTRSENLLQYTEQVNQDLTEINEGISRIGESSKDINKALTLWKQENISLFLDDLLVLLDQIQKNTGDLDQLQSELIKTSNNLKEGARMIEEKIIFVPRSNQLYQELNQLKELFLSLSSVMDENYDLISGKLNNLDPLLSSIEASKGKIKHIQRLEQTLDSGVKMEELEAILARMEDSSSLIDTGELQQQLTAIQDILKEIKTGQLPVIIDQLTYIQDSLPDMEDTEVVETINLIDRYIAGEVIPGDQIQLLIKGNYNEKVLVDLMQPLVKNPAVSYINMEAGRLQTNPRGEIFNVLRQVRAVISTIIALVFTLLAMLLDQSLIISIIRLNDGHGYFYSFFSGSFIFAAIYYLSSINFPYLNLTTNILIGGLFGIIVGFISGMLNPVSEEEWEAGKSLGFSFAEIMQEIMIPAGKPGLLFLLNYPRVKFK